MKLDLFIKKYFEETVPVSFNYGGKPVTAADFGPLTAAGEGEGCALFTRTMKSADGNFEAVLKISKYDTAVEWWLEVTGCGAFDSMKMNGLKYADLVMNPGVDFGKTCELPRLIWAHGSRARPDDFMPEYNPFQPDMVYNFECVGGRASDNRLPYFNLQVNESEGVVLAIGWSGQWQAKFERQPGKERKIAVEMRMDDADFRVEPGETLELPHMTALPWDGDVKDSFNIWRRFVRWNILPKYDGEPLYGCVGLRAWGGLTPDIHRSKFENAKKHGLDAEIYQIDAGWHGEGYEKSDNYYFDNWYLTIGTWKPLPAIYPDGMGKFGEDCRDAGMDLAIWFEPERMLSWNKMVNEHREYFIGARCPNEYDTKYASNMMVNLGNPEALAWITDQVSNVLGESKSKIFRIDFNYEPLPFWRYADGPERKGVTEIKYIAGLYKMLGDLLKRHPGLQIDNCASGGRRLDYRMFRYSIPMFCRSDYFCWQDNQPGPKQAHTFGLSLWTPAHADSLGSCIGQTPEVLDTYRWRSTLCSGIGATAPWWDLTEEEAAWYRKMIAEAKRVRPYMSEDFYPLTGYTLSDLDWMAWQMNKPEDGSGVVMAYRHEKSGCTEMQFELNALDADAKYVLEDADAGNLGEFTGAELANGFAVRLAEKRSCRIIFYKKA